MDFNQIIIAVVPAIISGLISYYSARHQSKIELKKLEVDIDKMKIQHQQELEKLKLAQSNKEKDLILATTEKVINGSLDLNNLAKLQNQANKITNKKRRR